MPNLKKATTSKYSETLCAGWELLQEPDDDLEAFDAAQHPLVCEALTDWFFPPLVLESLAYWACNVGIGSPEGPFSLFSTTDCTDLSEDSTVRSGEEKIEDVLCHLRGLESLSAVESWEPEPFVV